MWPLTTARVLFEGYRLSWLPTTRSTSSGLGKVVEDREPLTRYAVRRREFDFLVDLDDEAAFSTWLVNTDGALFDWYDIENLGDPATSTKVRLVNGKAGVTLASPRNGPHVTRRLEGHATVESNDVLGSPRATGWPYAVASPLWSRAMSLVQQQGTRTLLMDDGALRQGQAIKSLDRRTWSFAFDLENDDLGTFLGWLYGSDDRSFAMALPSPGATATTDVELVGGMGGVELVGDGQRTESGLVWRGIATVRTV